MLLFVTPLLHETIDYLPGVDLFCVAKEHSAQQKNLFSEARQLGNVSYLLVTQ